METLQITAREIFAANQILTLEKAKELIGKPIACTSPEYHMNSTHVTVMKIAEIIPEWELAGRRKWDDTYTTQQDWWLAYMDERSIDEYKTRLVLIGENNEGHFICHSKYWNFFDQLTFTGSDADRPVYYIEL